MAAALVNPGKIFAATTPPIPSIRIPKEITETLAEATHVGDFSEKGGMTGRGGFRQVLQGRRLAALFCCPGNYQIINAISAAGIPAFGGRSEGSMASAADGFSRCTGEVTACSGTEGPGFTNMIMNIAVAHRARTPLLVLASNVTIATDDREYFIQTGYQQPTTEGLKKYGKRLIAPDRVHEYTAYAFRNLKTGVPGPVHLDFPGEIYRHRFAAASEAEGLLQQGEISHRIAPASRAEGFGASRGHDQSRRASGDRGGARRIFPQGLGAADGGGGEERNCGGDVPDPCAGISPMSIASRPACRPTRS